MGSAEYGAARERNTYGSQAGRDLLEDRHDMKERIKRLEDWMANIDTQIADHEAQMTDLQHRIDTLTTDVEGLTEGRTRIKNDNVAAHEGDAITDAILYTTDQRDDEDALIRLYGLTADQISFLSKCLTS